MDFTPVDPLDEELVALTHPPDWVNPMPGGRYNLVAIGGGTAGLVAAIGTARLGGKAALIEAGLMGGDCLNWGCVPSKALIESARVAHTARNAGAYGVSTGEVRVDFDAVMQRMRRLRTHIAHHDSFARVRDEGVDAFLGNGRFTGPDTIEVAGQALRFARAVIATGSRARMPPIPGLEHVDPLTNETLFQLQDLPERLLVIGGGPVGCELAQVFARFGSQVTLVELGDQLLGNDDAEAAEVLREALCDEGVQVFLGATIDRIEPGQASLRTASSERSVAFDRVLVATGRTPNLEGLQLDAAGVASNPQGVITNRWFQTDNPRVYASGDVAAGVPRLTHAADEMSRRVLRNALFFGRRTKDAMVLPHATYTDPEVAHVGMSPREQAERGVATYRSDFADIDRAIVDGDTRGFVKIAVERSRIVGGTVVGAHAGELIGALSLAVAQGMSPMQLADTVQPYPTRIDAVRRAGFAWQQTRLTPFARSALETLLRWRR